MKISILTATYNRAKFLDKLYTSILVNSNNTNMEIEWLIMDDGSTDNTKILVENYEKERIIDVKYFYQKNQGKMAALNNLLKYVTGDWILECDSDDFLVSNSLKIIENSIEKCEKLEKIYAMVFLKYDQKGNNMGNNFPQNNYESTMFNLYFKEGVTGEKALVFNSNIRKNYMYELEKNEKFVTEARMYHKIDLNYKVECFNEKIMICEYRPDGYSQNIKRIFKENPYGYYNYFKEIFEHDLKKVNWKKRLYLYKHYILFSVLTKEKHVIKNVKGIENKFCVAILYLPGKIKTKKNF